MADAYTDRHRQEDPKGGAIKQEINEIGTK